MMNKIMFAHRFAELVSDSNKSMTLIAAELGVSKQTISAWCNGNRQPKAPTLSFIANYFKTSVRWLKGISDDKYPENYETINKKADEFVLMRVGRDSETGERYSIKIELVFIDNKPAISINGDIGDFSEVYSILSTEDKKAVLNKMMSLL